MLFSWVASCAFLITSESKLIEKAQTQTDEYMALEQRISNITLDIAFQQRLLNNRLESSYHSQWQAGQETAKTLAAQRETLAMLLETRSEVGQKQALNSVATTRFFQQAGQTLNVGSNTLRLLGYGVLSLLLEFSTFGMISLAHTLKSVVALSTVSENARAGQLPLNREAHNNIVSLISDILRGKMPPVLRKIQSAKYGIDIDVTRTLLVELHGAGLLEKDKRNSYKLSL